MDPEGEDRSRKTERIKLEFLSRELEISNTFIDVAETESKTSPVESVRAIRNAQVGCATISSWLPRIRDAQVREHLLGELNKLKDRLDRFEKNGRPV